MPMVLLLLNSRSFQPQCPSPNIEIVRKTALDTMMQALSRAGSQTHRSAHNLAGDLTISPARRATFVTFPTTPRGNVM